eukprot:2844454-Karenia_brevis.AAC.1
MASTAAAAPRHQRLNRRVPLLEIRKCGDINDFLVRPKSAGLKDRGAGGKVAEPRAAQPREGM